MGGCSFPCGCSTAFDMITGQTLRVSHCPEHFFLFSDKKTLHQMAVELSKLK